MTYVPDLVYPQVLWNSEAFNQKSTLSYNGTVYAGYEPANVVDWRDFSVFKAQAGKTLSFTSNPGTSLDTIVMWAAADSGSVTVSVYSGAVLIGALTLSANSMKWLDITSVPLTGQTISFVFNADCKIRLIACGAKLVMPQGQWMDMPPPTLLQGIIQDNMISVNGSILGRNLRRIERTAKLSLDYVDQDWVRSTWATFMSHVAHYGFFYRWNPITYPNEIVFSVAEDIVAPQNIKQPNWMHVELPMRFIA